MVSGELRVGKVVPHRGQGRSARWRIDFGRRWEPRYLNSFRGIAFESRHMAEAILAHVEIEVSKGRALDDVLSEFAPHAGPTSGVEPLLERWVQLFEEMVAAGDRQPRTLREYRRWAGKARSKEAHFAFWYGRSIWEVDVASLREWSYWLAKRGLAKKTRRNVMAGFRSFLSWVAEHRATFEVPRFPWPEPDEHLPTILSREVQDKVLAAVPEPKRGIYLALADLLLRPSEARVLRVRDWTGDEIRVERAAKDRLVQGIVRGPKKATGVKVLPVSERLAAWLEEHVPTERRLADADAPLFHNPEARRGGWWSETALRRVWGFACRRAGVSAVGLYSGTKHSSATYLKGLGADDRLLATIMGHRDPRSVQVYAKVQGTAIRSALAKLERRGA
jgi:integrase